jgi:anti-anti-sigma factor
MTNPEIERDGHRLTVHLAGELDQDTVPALTEQILDRLEPDVREVVLELGSVDFCDSAGIAMLVRAHRVASKQGATVLLRSPSPILKATFAVCGLTDLLPIDPAP